MPPTDMPRSRITSVSVLSLMVTWSSLAWACGATPPTAPSRPSDGQGSTSATPLTISRVQPEAGWPFYVTSVIGSGFKPGARVTFGGVDTRLVAVIDGTITLWPGWHEPGTVDVVVTNPDGSSVTLSNGFTIKAATLELSESDVAAGATLTATWSGPNDPSDFTPPDVIALYRVGDPQNSPLSKTHSGIGERFSWQFQAPSEPGAYEVRYHMRSEYLLAKVPLTVR